MFCYLRIAYFIYSPLFFSEPEIIGQLTQNVTSALDSPRTSHSRSAWPFATSRMTLFLSLFFPITINDPALPLSVYVWVHQFCTAQKRISKVGNGCLFVTSSSVKQAKGLKLNICMGICIFKASAYSEPGVRVSKGRTFSFKANILHFQLVLPLLRFHSWTSRCQVFADNSVFHANYW